MNLQEIECNGRMYYLESDLKELDKAYFYGCSKSRSIIAKKSIPDTEYVFALQTKKTGLWEVKNREYKPAKLLISKTWAVHNVPALRPPLSLTDAVETHHNREAISQGVQMAPPILELEDHEKFRDVEGNVLDIEVRGERHYKKCFFLVQDVSKTFELPNLRIVVSNETTSYIEGIDFINFIRPDVTNNDNRTNRKMLFLTYEGLMKTLYVSRSSFARQFREWATEKLFTIQMGDEEAREALAGEIIGVSPKTIREVFSKNTEKTPCVYLFQVSTARHMFPHDDKPDDDMICKYGYTDDLPRRTREHTKFFEEQKRLGNVNLLCFSIIDPRFLSDAESRLTRMFRHCRVSYEDQTELVRLNKREMKDIRSDFSLIQKSYLGCYTELVNKIHQMETEHQREVYDLKLLFQKEKSRADLLEKDVKIKELEKQVLEQMLELQTK